mmetsp:Transcript_20166/g.37534  ORF Transcript_20166/g.37534 Transcript_20166/m.37534 type:complete len:658 (-) Transcript_20166:4616-6589(-)
MQELTLISVLFALAAVCYMVFSHHQELRNYEAKLSVNVPQRPDPAVKRQKTSETGYEERPVRGVQEEFGIYQGVRGGQTTVKKRKQSENGYSQQGHEALFGELKKTQSASVKRIVIRDNGTTTDDIDRASLRKGLSAEILSAEQRRKNLRTLNAIKEQRVWTAYNHDSFVIMRNRFMSTNKPDVVVDFKKTDSPLPKAEATTEYKSPSEVRATEEKQKISSVTAPKSPERSQAAPSLFSSTPATEPKPNGLFGAPSALSKATESTATQSLFGGTVKAAATTTPAATSLFGGQAPQPPQPSQPAVIPEKMTLLQATQPAPPATEPKPSASLFGSGSSLPTQGSLSGTSLFGSTPAQTLASNALFSQARPPSEDPKPVSEAPKSLFGAQTDTKPLPQGTLFGLAPQTPVAPSILKPEVTEQPKVAPSLVGAPSAPTSLFGSSVGIPQPNAPAPPSLASFPQATPGPASNPLFPGTSVPGSSLFASGSTPATQGFLASTISSNPSGFQGPATQPTANPPTTTLFGQPSSTALSTSGMQTASSGFTGMASQVPSLFGAQGFQSVKTTQSNPLFAGPSADKANPQGFAASQSLFTSPQSTGQTLNPLFSTQGGVPTTNPPGSAPQSLFGGAMSSVTPGGAPAGSQAGSSFPIPSTFQSFQKG